MNNELVVINSQVPANLEDLSKFILIGKEKLISVKAEIRAMKSLKIAEEVYKQKEIEAKELGGALLLAKVRIGEMLKEIPKATPNPKAKNNEIDSTVDFDSPKETKQEKVKDLGFSQKESERFQQLAENKEIVEDVIENSEDIPTQTECLKKLGILTFEKSLKTYKEKIEMLGVLHFENVPKKGWYEKVLTFEIRKPKRFFQLKPQPEVKYLLLFWLCSF